MTMEWRQPQRGPYWGVDRRVEQRPGVPREAPPRPVEHSHWAEPEQQMPTVVVLKRAGLERLTPVFGTAQPPHGLSGTLRRMAYGIPEHLARHWIVLLIADRVDVLEGRLARLVRFSPLAAVRSRLARLRAAWFGPHA